MVDKSPFDSQSNPNDENDDVPSLEDRAAKSARAELRGERTGILGASPQSPLPRLRRRRTVPKDWSWIYVLERLVEAFRTLRRLPMPTRPRGFINSMPFYVYDRADLNSQLETDELERMARLRNRVRILPSPDEIMRMEEAIWWPIKYLSDAEDLARAVNLAAMWAATDADVDKGLRRIKTTRREFNARKLRGLCVITQGVIRDRVPIK
jgi:hypothetical protein